MLELSSEDLLRLNVLLANATAIRIDEHHMVVYGLGEDRDYEVHLNALGNEQAYLSKVRELLSTAMFGSPRRYPKYLHRWAGMGQINSVPVDKLLMLGEPEVMLAVAHNSSLTGTQAQRAWWAYPGPELGRCLLAKAASLPDDFARELVAYLLEYLPFETRTLDIMDTVSLVLASGLADAQTCAGIWHRGLRKKAYRIGFLLGDVDKVPERQSPRQDLAPLAPVLAQLALDHPLAALAYRVLDVGGQTFVAVALDCLPKCADQDEVNALLDALHRFFAIPGLTESSLETPEAVNAMVAQHLDRAGAPIITQLPTLAGTVPALLAMTQVSADLTIPFFSKSDAAGSVMRKQLQALTEYLQQQLQVLRQSGN